MEGQLPPPDCTALRTEAGSWPLGDLDMESPVCSPEERPGKEGGFLCLCCRGPRSAADRSQVLTWHGVSRGLTPPLQSFPAVPYIPGHLGSSPGSGQSLGICCKREPHRVMGHRVSFTLNYASQAEDDCLQQLNLV